VIALCSCPAGRDDVVTRILDPARTVRSFASDGGCTAPVRDPLVRRVARAPNGS
jgi:hypothetical protein